MNPSTLLPSIVALLITVQAASAASVYTNPITDTNPSAVNPYTNGQILDANLTATGIGRGSGVNTSSSLNRYSGSNWTLAAALDANDYYTWTLTPNAGFKLSLNSLSFTPQSSGSGVGTAALRSSLDSFATDIGTATIARTSNVDTLKTISLSATAFQNLTSSITFNLYGYAATSTTGTFSINDFTFDGTVSALPPTAAIPLPTAALMAPTLLPFLSRRRR